MKSLLLTLFLVLSGCGLGNGEWKSNAPRYSKEVRGKKYLPSRVKKGHRGVVLAVNKNVYIPVGMWLKRRGQRGPYVGIFYKVRF